MYVYVRIYNIYTYIYRGLNDIQLPKYFVVVNILTATNKQRAGFW